MKRISKLSLVLMLIALMAVYLPSAFAEETTPLTCEAGYHSEEIVPGFPECVPDMLPPPTCLTSVSCDPCLSGGACEPCIAVMPCTPEVTPVAPVVVNDPAPAAPAPQDGKGISFNDSDLGVSLYVNEDENGAPMLEVYETQNQTETGNFALTVTQDDLAQYVGNLPTENVLLKAQGHVKIYVLTTGEISIFVGPDSEGKVHVKVFNGIPWTHVYGFTIDPV